MARIERSASPDPTWSSRHSEIDGDTIRRVQAYVGARREHSDVEPGLADVWRRFFSDYDSLIRQRACRGLVQAADREDCCQDIWCTVIRGLEGYDPGRAPFESWLQTIIVHAAADQTHRASRCRHADLASGWGMVAGSPDLDEPEEKRRRVEIAMAKLRTRLSDANYQIFHDHWFEGKSYSAIAASFGLSVKQVRDRHHRAMVVLRELLSED